MAWSGGVAVNLVSDSVGGPEDSGSGLLISALATRLQMEKLT